MYFLSFLLLLDSGHGGQTKDLDGDEGDGFDEGGSILFYFLKMIDLANSNDVYSYLSCKLLGLCDTDVSPTYVNDYRWISRQMAILSTM